MLAAAMVTIGKVLQYIWNRCFYNEKDTQYLHCVPEGVPSIIPPNSRWRQRPDEFYVSTG